jgi:hypothetical protein
MRNSKSHRKARTVKGIQHRIDAGCRQTRLAKITQREMRTGDDE